MHPPAPTIPFCHFNFHGDPVTKYKMNFGVQTYNFKKVKENNSTTGIRSRSGRGDRVQTDWQEVLELANQYRSTRLDYWIHEVLFSFQWWILLIVTIALIIVWLIILDKKRIFEIIIYGLMVALIANTGDSFGISFSLWGYPYSLFHTPEIIEIHDFLMPIIYMIIYQYFRTWKSFMMANAINAFFFALILEPLLVWLGIYELYQWSYLYSIIPYFAIAVGLKWIIEKLKQDDEHYP